MTYLAPQDDGLNLNFLKDVIVVAKKWPKMVVKWPFMSCIFPKKKSYKIENKRNGNKL